MNIAAYLKEHRLITDGAMGTYYQKKYKDEQIFVERANTEAPERVKEIMRQVIGAHPKALFTPEPFVRTTSLGESSVGYTLRVWCATQDYWDLYYDLLEQIRAAFDREGIELTYNHLNVHIMKE